MAPIPKSLRVSITLTILLLSRRVLEVLKKSPESHFSSFFVALLEITIVAPQGSSVFSALDYDAARPCCSDSSGIRVFLKSWLFELVCCAMILELLDPALSRRGGHGDFSGAYVRCRTRYSM